jgi:hypothetical protein
MHRMRRLIRVWDKSKALEIPPRQVSSLEQTEEITKEVLNRLWQAFGHEWAPLFDDSGNLKKSSSQ